MELLAVRQARVIAFLNAEELNPNGRPIAHDFMSAFVERYRFTKRPTTAEEILDVENKGLVFEIGALNEVGIDKLVLFNWGIVVDTSTSTDASEAILQDMLDWGASTFELSNRPSLITRRNYLSEVVFYSEMALPALNPAVQAVGDGITNLLAGYHGNSIHFEVSGINLSPDPSLSKLSTAAFQLHRLADTPFSQKKYYSAAPLKTSDHIQIIKDIEHMLMLQSPEALLR